MSSGSWTPLIEVRDAARHGNKAVQLAALLRAGLPVADGWVLEMSSAADATELATRLLALHPTPTWILRSSSPLEDRPGDSAAGHFHSGSAAADADAIATEIKKVRAHDVAVLAQPYFDFERWYTLECRAPSWRLEGRRGAEAVRQSGTAPQGDDLVQLGVRAAATADVDPALLELGATRDRLYVLQLRPAPARAPKISTEAEPQDLKLPGLGLHVHPADGDFTWIADHAHCPTPLCPLLAGLFGRWILARPPETTSRLQDGVWHDRDHPRASANGTDEARDRYHQWKAALAFVATALDDLEAEPRPWAEFVEEWLEWQTLYYAMPSGACRRWARTTLEAGFDPGELPTTIVARRRQHWAFLRTRILERDPAAPRTADALGRWVAALAPNDALRTALMDELYDSRHLTALAYDGRGVTFGEDPILFWREVLRARTHEHPAKPELTDTPRTLALAILALAEDDNDLLIRSYALFRTAVLAIAARRGHVPAQDLFDLLPDDLDGWLAADGPLPNHSLRRGRALRAHFEQAWHAPTSGDLRGHAAAPGRHEGRAATATTLSEIDDPDATVAVVRTLTPHDGIHVSRFGAIICETGETLGHAAVLAREHGVVCVVGVSGALATIDSGAQVLVDGDSGRVRRLDEDDPS